ncbi:MAG TPA: YhcH/YjgK/YiaL family protein [Kiritimatiellia bacterium]|nr:YhcH/YjgK/YiaL family protein [Kiritimatiellia bacterium]
MVLDHVDRMSVYENLQPGFARAFAFLRDADLAALPPGRTELLEGRLFAIVDHLDGRGRTGAVLEAHRKFIDVQFTVSGPEEIGWRDLASCRAPREPFDEGRDIGFFLDPVHTWAAVPPGYFCILFPTDAHAPLGGLGPLRKVIMKVALDWPV